MKAEREKVERQSGEASGFSAAKLLEFEHAAYLRDKIKELEGEQSKAFAATRKIPK